MIKLNYKNNTGFTLLEALVAISILMVAIAAPITIAQKGLSSAIYTKSQMIASYLAQDAFEYIKNVRDVVSINNPDNSYDWDSLNALSDCKVEDFLTGFGCQIDTNANGGLGEIKIYNASSLSISNGFYGYSAGGTETSFIRQIQIKLNPTGSNTDEALVVVTVKWGTTADKQIIVKGLIYNY